MWKESYRLGVDRIDEQHRKLFQMTEDLVEAVNVNAATEVYQKILDFLKEYVIYHFHDEEEYQASIHYSGIEEHKAMHREFTQTVLDYEKELLDNGFDRSTMQRLAGTLTAWLIYHVADSDQMIVSGQAETPKQNNTELYVDLFSDSAVDVIEKMAGINRNMVQQKTMKNYKLSGDIFIEIELVGDLKRKAVFGFSKQLALDLIRSMTMMDLNELDELVQSALCELTNISCGNATIQLAEKGLSCDIKPPVLCDGIADDSEITSVYIDTGVGGMEVAILLNKES